MIARPDQNTAVPAQFYMEHSERGGPLNSNDPGAWRMKRSDLEQLDLRHLEDLSDKPV